MKKKSILLSLALVTAFSAVSAVAVQQSYQGEPIGVVAEGTTTEAAPKSVQYYSDLGPGWGACLYVDFQFASALDYRIQITDTSKVSLKNAAGENILGYFETWGQGLLLNRAQNYVCAVGDTLTLEAGFTVNALDGTVYEIKQTVKYVCNDTASAWTLVSETAETAKTALIVADVNYSANIMGDYGSGVIIGCGTDLGLGYWNVIDTQGKVSLIGSDGTEKTIGRFESCGSSLALNRSQSYVCSVGDILTLKAGLVIGEFEIKEDVSYQYATENTPWTLYTGELPTPPAEGGEEGSDGDEEVTLTELTVKDVNYTNYAGFAGNCVAIGFNVDSLGVADWTQLTDEATQTSKISLVDKDGNSVAITYIDSQGKYVMINRGQSHVCSVGDILTIKAGFTVGNYVVKEDISYKYATANSPWTLYTGEEEPEPETELTFATVEGQAYPYSAYYIHDAATWGMSAMIFRFNTAKTFETYQGVETLDLIEYVNAYGETVEIESDCIYVGENNFLLRWTAYGAENIYAMAGDKITFKKGFALAGNEKLAEDVTFVVTQAANSQLAPYTSDCAPSGLSITTSDEYKQITVGVDLQLQYAIANGFGTPYFTTSNENVATVTKDGLVSGVAEGTATITAHLGSETVDFDMTILPASPITGVELVNSYTVWVAQNETLVLPEDLKVHIAFENGQYGAEFALTSENCTFEADTSVLGNQTVTLTISYQGEEYTLDIAVSVYEIGDVSIKEVSIVEWFNFAIFIQYPDSTANNANITTDIGKLDNIFDRITYKRADGTDIPVNSGYMLSGGNIAIFPFGGEELTIDNYNQFYLEGDVIRLEEGMKIWMWTGEKENTGTDNNAIKAGTGMYICEGVLKQTVEYRYDGNVWSLYLEYTDLSAASSNITVEAGKTADAGVTRVPVNATTGTFTYVSSDETVATVSSRGVIKGISEGTCTITVTLDGGNAGAKTIVLNITVTDKITGIAITPNEINIVKGGTPDLATLSATWTWQSGKAGEAVDLSNATLVGFDSETIGEQMVVVVVTSNGVEYSGTITIIVEEEQSTLVGFITSMIDNLKNGCSGSIAAVSCFAPLTMLGAGLLLSKKKRK